MRNTIEYFEKHHVSSIKEINFLFYKNFVGLVFLISSIVYLNNYVELTIIGYYFYSFLAISVFLLFFDISGRELFYSLKLKFSKEKDQALDEIKEYSKMNRRAAKKVEPKIYFEFPEFNELEKWCEENVSSRKSFKKVISKYCAKDKNGIFDKAIVLWREAVPLSLVDENIGLELIRHIKIAPRYGKEEYLPRVDNYFKKYNQSQIKTIFDSSFDGELYIKELRKYMDKEDKPFPVFSRMNQLIDFLMFQNVNNIKFSNPSIDLSIDSPSLVIRRISDSVSLYLYAEKFRNCAKSYLGSLQSEKYDFYIVESDKPIMFHVNKKLKILEAKYPLNQMISEEDRYVLEEHIEKLKKMKISS